MVYSQTQPSHKVCNDSSPLLYVDICIYVYTCVMSNFLSPDSNRPPTPPPMHIGDLCPPTMGGGVGHWFLTKSVLRLGGGDRSLEKEVFRSKKKIGHQTGQTSKKVSFNQEGSLLGIEEGGVPEVKCFGCNSTCGNTRHAWPGKPQKPP